jgi:UPF0755 protein
MKNCLVLIIVLVVLFGIGGFTAYSWYNNIATSPASNSQDKVEITVGEGDNLNTISKQLETAGVIQNELALKIYVRVNNLEPNIKAGSYKISKNLTMSEVIKKLEAGVFRSSILVTLREALRPDQAVVIIQDKLKEIDEDVKFSGTEYLDIAENPQNYSFSEKAQAFLDANKPADKPLIGFLFPDTYSLDSNTTALDLVNIQIENLIKRLEENNVNISDVTPETPTFYDVLILASIIDKEAAGADDRQLISSVFHNRLADGMPLQSDATINFFTRRDDPRSTLEETQIDNPYNLYKYPGLTPTPINNPGVMSIYAALYPKESDYYYFRHDRSAKIYFSRTFAEHQNSIYMYP